MHIATRVAPEHDIVAEQLRGQRPVRELIGQHDGVEQRRFDHAEQILRSRWKKAARGGLQFTRNDAAYFLSPPGTLPSTPLT